MKKFLDSSLTILGHMFYGFDANDLNDSNLDTIKKRYRNLEAQGFFTGAKEVPNNQAFIKALFAYDVWKADAFTKAIGFAYSWDQGSDIPLKLFLKFIEETFFTKPHASIYKQTFIEALFQQIDGTNDFARAVKHKGAEGTNPLQIVLNTLAAANCFDGEFSEINKQRFVIAICSPDRQGDNVFKYSLFFRPYYHLLLDTLITKGCFEGPRALLNKKLCLDGILKVNIRGDNPLAFAAALKADRLLPRTFEFLKYLGCFTNNEKKQKFINAMFLQNEEDSSSAFSKALEPHNFLALDMLKEADCFIDGPMALTNRQAFIDAVLIPKKQNNTSLLLDHAHYPSLIPLLEYLDMMGCFSGNSANKEAFINAVFSQDSYQDNILSSTFRPQGFILLLEKLRKAGCFDTENNRVRFLQSIRNNQQAVLRHSLFDLKSYEALHECMLEAGCSPQNIKYLLNESVTEQYAAFKVVTPLMESIAKFGREDARVLRLITDGASLTPEQIEEVQTYEKRKAARIEENAQKRLKVTEEQPTVVCGM